jgi:hypothetical protein
MYGTSEYDFKFLFDFKTEAVRVKSRFSSKMLHLKFNDDWRNQK